MTSLCHVAGDSGLQSWLRMGRAGGASWADWPAALTLPLHPELCGKREALLRSQKDAAYGGLVLGPSPLYRSFWNDES